MPLTIISLEQKEFFRQLCGKFQEILGRETLGCVGTTFGQTPPSLQAFAVKITLLLNDLHAIDQYPHTLSVDYDPLAKLIILTLRRETAMRVQSRQAKTSNPEVINLLNQELAYFEQWMQEQWLLGTSPSKMPRLSDFLTLEEFEKFTQEQNIHLPSRVYDEKFHILQSPSLRFEDLHYYRGVCAARGIEIAAAFLDIDDFKSLNTRHGHNVVDEDVLPVFMRTLEGFTFSRGQAYRLGGDEYIVLLPNGEAAVSALHGLREKLARLSYRGIDDKTTVSIGLCMVEPECFLTDTEIYERANRAMRYAKDQGKNRIAGFCGELFRNEDLILL